MYIYITIHHVSVENVCLYKSFYTFCILFLLNIFLLHLHLSSSAVGCFQKMMHVYTPLSLLFNQLPITLEHPRKDVAVLLGAVWLELSSARHEKRGERRASLKERERPAVVMPQPVAA